MINTDFGIDIINLRWVLRILLLRRKNGTLPLRCRRISSKGLILVSAGEADQSNRTKAALSNLHFVLNKKRRPSSSHKWDSKVKSIAIQLPTSNSSRLTPFNRIKRDKKSRWAMQKCHHLGNLTAYPMKHTSQSLM